MLMRSRASTISPDVLGTPGGGQDRAPENMDVGHRLGGEVHQVVAVLGDKPLKAVAHPVDMPHPVKVIELQDDGPDDIVGAGAQAAAGDDGAVHLGRVEVDLGPGPGQSPGRGALLPGPGSPDSPGSHGPRPGPCLRQSSFPGPGHGGPPWHISGSGFALWARPKWESRCRNLQISSWLSCRCAFSSSRHSPMPAHRQRSAPRYPSFRPRLLKLQGRAGS